MLAFSWCNDIPDQEPYSYYINTPLETQKLSTITISPLGNRFTKHSLSDFHPEHTEAETTQKNYKIGDEI